MTGTQERVENRLCIILYNHRRICTMQKTNLGISVALMGAGLYFLGLFSFIPAFLLAAYVLLREEDAWLKRNAIRMVVIVIGFYVLHVGVDLLQEIWGVINCILGWIPFLNLHFSFPLNLDSIANYIISFLENLVLLLSGFKALSGNMIKVDFADKLLSKHLD